MSELFLWYRNFNFFVKSDVLPLNFEKANENFTGPYSGVEFFSDKCEECGNSWECVADSIFSARRWKAKRPPPTPTSPPTLNHSSWEEKFTDYENVREYCMLIRHTIITPYFQAI